MGRIQKHSAIDFPSELFLSLTEAIYGNPNRDKLPKQSNYREMSYFLMDNKNARATATVYSNSALQVDGKSAWMIGNFEALDVDCQELFAAISIDASAVGVDQLIGPMNGSTWQEHRFIVDQFGAPFLSEMSHPKYYPELWKQNKFSTFQRYFSYKDSAIITNDEGFSKLEQHFSSLKLTLRTIDLSNFEQELERIYELCVRAFRKNILYSEISKERFVASYLPFHTWLKEDYIWIAENDQKECLGFLFAFENKLNPTEKELIVKTIARSPSLEYNGLGTILGNQFMKKAIENGVTSILHAFMHESNTSKNLSQRFNGECIRTYELFSKNLGSI